MFSIERLALNFLSSTKRYANIDREVHKIVKTHQKKLKALTRNCVLPFDSKDTITNISSHKLTEDENEALIFGLSHSIVPPYINETDIFACFESIFHSMAGRLIDRRIKIH